MGFRKVYTCLPAGTCLDISHHAADEWDHDWSGWGDWSGWSGSKRDKDLKFCSNFFQRKKASFSREQEQQLLSLEREVCTEEC